MQIVFYFNPNDKNHLAAYSGRTGWFAMKHSRCQRLIDLGMFIPVKGFQGVYTYNG